MKNRYDALLEKNNVGADHRHLMESIATTAHELLPKKKRRCGRRIPIRTLTSSTITIFSKSHLWHIALLEGGKKQLDEANTSRDRELF